MSNLDYDLISQFVKVTNDTPQEKKENTVYGTVRLLYGERYIQLDGADSDVLTPVDLSMDAKVGDRVMVMIKDHRAVANADTTTISARKTQMDALNDHLDVRYDENERIVDSKVNIIGSKVDNIDSEIFIEDSGVSVIHSKIATNESEIGAVRTKMDSIDSDIFLQDSGVSVIGSQLKAIGSDYYLKDSSGAVIDSKVNIINSVFTIEDGKITGIHSIDAEFASFKALDTDLATVEKLFAKSGTIANIVTEDERITGTLVGVTVLADSLLANSITVDKLVVRGEDGLFYKLNTENMELDDAGDYILDEDGNPIPKELPTLDNSIHGSIIAAKSITAEKVAVTDLVAFGATIGGFSIVADAIHSVSKPSVDSTNSGIYLGNDGQMNIGDASNYMKYYKDASGNFRLDIRADDISFSGLDEIQNKLGRIELNPVGADPYIQLSAEGSDFAIRISNSQIDFKRGDATPAWINNQQLHINQAVIEDELRFGNFVWAEHGTETSKNMGLMWQG